MRFLADENFPRSAAIALSDLGHDVIQIGVASPGTSDLDIIAWAAREGRILLTFDKDFGEITRGVNVPLSCGVVLFRLPMPPTKDVGPNLASLIDGRRDWVGHFAVIEPDRIRMRPL